MNLYQLKKLKKGDIIKIIKCNSLSEGEIECFNGRNCTGKKFTVKSKFLFKDYTLDFEIEVEEFSNCYFNDLDILEIVK